MTEILKQNLELTTENRTLEDKQRRYRLKHKRMITNIAKLTDENVNLRAWAVRAIRESDRFKTLLAKHNIETNLPMGRLL